MAENIPTPSWAHMDHKEDEINAMESSDAATENVAASSEVEISKNLSASSSTASTSSLGLGLKRQYDEDVLLLHEDWKRLRYDEDENDEEDDCDVFGRIVLMKLEEIKDKNVQALVRKVIHQILVNVDMGNYSHLGDINLLDRKVRGPAGFR